MTMIMSTHQISFAGEMADEILFMENGIIVEAGPPKKLFAQAECQRTREFFMKIAEIYGESR